MIVQKSVISFYKAFERKVFSYVNLKLHHFSICLLMCYPSKVVTLTTWHFIECVRYSVVKMTILKISMEHMCVATASNLEQAYIT